MSYLDHIEDLNRRSSDHFRPLRVAGQVVGRVRDAFAEQLARWPEVFLVDRDAVVLKPELDNFQTRSDAVARVVATLHQEGIIARHHGEPYAIAPGFSDPALMVLDRASVAYFGVKAYGQHLNGFVRDRDGIKMWLGRRSRSKPSFPGMLDQLVAGGLPHGISLRANLAKECAEEAGISPEMAARARSVGTVSYCRETGAGLKPDLLFNYDLELPPNFEPRALDGEMEGFVLLPLDEVAALVEHGREIKANCNLVIIDFLIRHGWLGPEHPDYIAISQGLRA